MKGVYLIPYSCGTPYIGETGRSIHQRINEHVGDLRHGRTKSSLLAEHVEKTKHQVCIEEAKVVAKVAHFHHRKFREAIEIERSLTISIEMMAGKSVAVGSLPCCLSLSPSTPPTLSFFLLSLFPREPSFLLVFICGFYWSFSCPFFLVLLLLYNYYFYSFILFYFHFSTYFYLN